LKRQDRGTACPGQQEADWSVEATYSQRGSAYSEHGFHRRFNSAAMGPEEPARPRSRGQAGAGRRIPARYEELLRITYDAELRNLLNDWRTGKAPCRALSGDELIPLATQRTDAALTAYRTGQGRPRRYAIGAPAR
jgi:hypothetical protein